METNVTPPQSEGPITPERQKQITYSKKFWGRVIFILKLFFQILLVAAGWFLFAFLLQILVDAIYPPPPLCLGIPWLGPGPDPCRTYMPDPNRPIAVLLSTIFSYVYIPVVVSILLKPYFHQYAKPIFRLCVLCILLIIGCGIYFGMRSIKKSQESHVNTPVYPQNTQTTPTVLPGYQDTAIDTLDYFLSDHADQGLTGTHPLSQTVDGNSVYSVKWSAKSYERHFWDDTYIYLREDHSEAPNQPYTFSPGIWMKRRMSVGESLVFTSGENKIQFFTNRCDPVSTNSGDYRYIMTLAEHNPSFDAGGDLGVQDVIVLIYDYRPAGAVNYEKFYYSKEWGWIRWENVDANGNVVQVSEFNKINKVISPDRDVSCL